MEKYVVLTNKPVTVRVGTHQDSEYKAFKRGETFETSADFVKDLIAANFVKAAEEESSKAAAKKTLDKSSKPEGNK